MSSLRSLGLSLAIALAPLACGPTYVANDAGGDDDTGSDDQAGSGGAEPEPASGGSESAGCNVDADCMVAADWRDECFSPDCSHPIAVTKVTLAADTCLVPWDERWEENLPEERPTRVLRSIGGHGPFAPEEWVAKETTSDRSAAGRGMALTCLSCTV